MPANINSALTLNLVIIFSLLLTACTQPAEDPKLVADTYWKLLQSGDTAEAEKLVSINSRRDFPAHDLRITPSTHIDSGEARTVVTTTITTTNPDNNFSHTQTFNTVLVLQQGQWKIDISQSPIPPALSSDEEELHKLTEDLSQSMQENLKSIDESMSQGMQLLNEALREGSKEMGDSLLNLMNELNSSMKDSIDKMKKRKQQLPEQPPQDPAPEADPGKGEGMI